jgi:hypothetical protein
MAAILVSCQGHWIQLCMYTPMKRMIHINVGLNSPVISEEEVFEKV